MLRGVRYFVGLGLGAWALVAAPSDAAAPLRAGAGAVAMRLPAEIPLAGYGERGFRNRSEGTLAPVEARALVVEGPGGGPRVALVALDVLIVTTPLRESLAHRTRDLDLDALLVAATHTHSGPGAYVDQWLAELGIMGGYRPDVFETLVGAAEQALRLAHRQRVPARLGSAVATAPGLARNRRREGGPRETLVPVLRVDDAGGRALATLFALGSHPVALSAENRRLSPDYPGAARERVEEELGGMALFLAGPLGDQNPVLPDRPRWTDDRSQHLEVQLRDAEELGARLGDVVADAAGSIRTEADASVAFHSTIWELPRVDVRIRCVGYVLGPLLHHAARRSLSREARIDALRLGDLRVLGSPFELGTEVAAAIRSRDRSPLLVAAHVNDWLGYLLMPDDWARHGYETCLSFHGGEVGPAFVEQALHTLEPLGRPPSPRSR